jgi:dihydrofolate reductase
MIEKLVGAPASAQNDARALSAGVDVPDSACRRPALDFGDPGSCARVSLVLATGDESAGRVEFDRKTGGVRRGTGGTLMRKLKAWQYVTLDGVVEAPEKWVMGDDRMFEEQTADYNESDALLLGRRTYEVFAASWPQRGSEVQNADWMNNTQKYVVSTSLESPEWQHTTVLTGDVGDEVSRLKEQDGKAIMVNGSATLLRSLLAEGLVDELRLYLHPIVVVSGDRLFDDAETRIDLGLAETHAYQNGVVSLTYARAQG